ncbi:PTS fructose transporter subunit IIA [Amylibacter sp. SFDW26]|uniref:PTS sugar transporter subunit IIA n=1 Tax=Amylibacter sp. SFDW26 TaxID=2652722 RepID=UPI0012620AA9|nr:PTS fructose transporter subunit IIA [Amylibacter sp. SFDW26]KAB7614876.1 PTS fructose transporter subunit IIA [Amylibacter sp. SFDW26]
MIGVVIVAHGGLAKEYLAAVEHVVGKQEGIQAISIAAECDRMAKQEEICAVADKLDTGDGVIVVVDMFGGSPANLSMMACSAKKRKILYGANLPMLVKLAKSRNLPVEQAIETSMAAGKKYMNCCNC